VPCSTFVALRQKKDIQAHSVAPKMIDDFFAFKPV
jgi:hypothetical protein